MNKTNFFYEPFLINLKQVTMFLKGNKSLKELFISQFVSSTFFFVNPNSLLVSFLCYVFFDHLFCWMDMLDKKITIIPSIGVI